MQKLFLKEQMFFLWRKSDQSCVRMFMGPPLRNKILFKTASPAKIKNESCLNRVITSEIISILHDIFRITKKLEKGKDKSQN